MNFYMSKLKIIQTGCLAFTAIEYHWSRTFKLEADLIKYQGKGIKLAHAHQQMRLDDKRFDGIYDISERLGKPLYIHVNQSNP